MSDINHDLFDCRKEQDQKFIDAQKHSTRISVISLGIVITIFVALTGFMATKLDVIEKLGIETATKVELILNNNGNSKK